MGTFLGVGGDWPDVVQGKGLSGPWQVRPEMQQAHLVIMCYGPNVGTPPSPIHMLKS